VQMDNRCKTAIATTNTTTTTTTRLINKHTKTNNE